MPSSRIQWIDFCRVWTAFFVIVRHTQAPEGSFFFLADLFNYRSLIFFFFFASGLFSKSEKNPTVGGGYRYLDIRRAGQILAMFAFWSLFGAVLLSPLHYQEIWSQGEIVWRRVLSAMGITWAFGWNVPLWFLRVLLVLALFAPVLHRLSNRLLVVFVIGMLAAGEVFCIEAWEEGGNACRLVPYRMYESLYAWAFFAGGILLRRTIGIGGLTEFLQKSGWLIILFALALFVPVRLWGLMPPCQSGMLVMLGVGTILSIGCLVEMYAPRVCSYVASWGPAAFFIYVTHYIIISYVKWLWNYLFDWGITGSLLVPVITLILSCIIFVIMRRFCPLLMCRIAMLKSVRK